MRTRLFRSIIVFGATLGVGSAVATLGTACTLYPEEHPHVDGGYVIIDASIWYDDGGSYHGIADGPPPPDAAVAPADCGGARDAGAAGDAGTAGDAGAAGAAG